MNRKRYWLIHKLSRSSYAPVPATEAGEHDWSDAALTTADDESRKLKRAKRMEREFQKSITRAYTP